MNPFTIGPYRPIYLWGGPGTVRMNKLKFMGVQNDEFVHQEAHTPPGRDRVLNDMYCNWVHLMYDWGFPPEIEEEDWDAFEAATQVYHEGDTQVFAYIQTSNCVYDGSFVSQDWYAVDPRGRKITYFTYGGRYMACMTHPDWVQHLKDLVAGAIQRGADGIFCDNLFHGASPSPLFGAWLGAAGCYCDRCRRAFREASSHDIPTQMIAGDPATAAYLRWRADRVTALLADLKAHANELQAGAPLSCNDFDPIMRDSYLVYGIDLEGLARVQDVTMIENYGLPHWDAGKRRLANNALTIRTAHAMIGNHAHLSLLSYDVGIGFDPVYPPRRYQQGMAEAAACGASMTTKGTEYHDGVQMTLLTDAKYSPAHAAIGAFNRWLEAHQDLYTGRRPAAPAAILYPGEALWLDWFRMAPLYFGAGQVLTTAGIPWRVVRADDDLQDVAVLLTFGPAQLPAPSGVALIDVTALPTWVPARPSLAGRSRGWNRVVTAGAKAAMQLYSDVKWARQAMEAVGLHKLVTQTPLYYLPEPARRDALLDALPEAVYPRVTAETPVLIDVWQQGNIQQVHLANYTDTARPVRVHFAAPVVAEVIVFGEDHVETLSGATLEVPLDVMTILLAKPEAT
ncbi:MAG: hypothetical protein JXB35_18225 [Anaerolineae bacterium]|nr:hypothetical protein [Anaerolineae bacterium]